MAVDEFDDAEDSCRDYHQAFRTLVQDYLQKLSCAIELTIGTWLTESLLGSLRSLHQVLCMLQFERVLIPELKCKSLTLELHIEKFNLYGAAGLLRASPQAESLNIYISAIHLYHSCCRFEL
ncbi:uncharacterized protein LOC129887319 isoform X2 [Solanum dulcamara]|uniref:uncharacterized protein LOC129887319 isoform X2 n=1 Tax=Solanum dulcamara TaxID=45834 RepID=UPI00248601BE|nr:uncharacterized protein LOC129887319 isoform X2 [Solanum dulcamara]XP_055818351.1 uncharacterized protein LOC129887319 isoform X2 [Solanum dulcamara]